jgi:hypothetical protein
MIWDQDPDNIPTPQPKPEYLEVWLIVAGICLCLSLLIAGMARHEDAIGAEPAVSKVSR